MTSFPVDELLAKPAGSTTERANAIELRGVGKTYGDAVALRDADGQPGRTAYAWRLADRWHRLEVRTRGRPTLPEPASEAAPGSEPRR